MFPECAVVMICLRQLNFFPLDLQYNCTFRLFVFPVFLIILMFEELQNGINIKEEKRKCFI